jgi:CRISPR-associated protein Csm1
MDGEQKVVVLTALLHDIGKFSQRAGGEKSDNEFLMPTYKGKPSHWHVLYTDAFVENKNILPLPDDIEIENIRDIRSFIARKAAAHHNPDTNNLLEQCITIGDRLSSGLERLPDETPRDREYFKKARLNAIVDEIELNKHKFERKWFYLLRELKGDNIFPVQGEYIEDEDQYEKLFNAFKDELRKIKGKLPFRHYLSWLLNVLERFTWSVPSSTYETVPDVSLYDHLKGTASIAEALYVYHREKGEIPKEFDKEAKFILAGGDLSGIQSYIFGVTESSGKGITRLFRARSFYLQALTRSVVLYILEKLDLSELSLIMDAGGKFMLLLPNLPRIKEEMKEISEEIDRFFWNKFNGELSLSLSYDLELTQENFKLGKFHEVLGALEDKLNEAKQHKFETILKSQPPIIKREIVDICDVCGKNPADERYSDDFTKKENTDKKICEDCYEQIEKIGRDLPGANYIVYGRDLPRSIKLFKDVEGTFFKDVDKIVDKNLYIQGLKEDTVFGRGYVAGYMPRILEEDLKDEDFHKEAEEEYKETNSENLMGKTMTFSLIAEKSRRIKNDKKVGRPLLGILKADVDNLGFIFSIGFEKNKMSLSRFVSLSRMINYFFATYLVNLIEEKYRCTYVVFAGGDDLFLVGPWRQITDLATEIRDLFGRFSADNEDISMSAGVSVVKPHMPLRRAAEMAEELLGRSKGYKENCELKKDAITLFEHTLKWTDMKDQIDFSDWFTDRLDDRESNVTTGFLYRLLEYSRRAERFFEATDKCKFNQKNERDALYISAAHYDISRNIAQIENNECINQDEVDRLLSLFKKTDEIRRLPVALTIAINQSRR